MSEIYSAKLIEEGLLTREEVDRMYADFRALLSRLGTLAVTPIPVCARDGDNVTAPSSRMPWYSGPTLLGALEVA